MSYWGIAHSVISSNVYNAWLLDLIRPEVVKVLRKNKNCIRINRSSTPQILTIRRIIERERAKYLKSTLLFVDISKSFDFIHSRKIDQMLLIYDFLRWWHRLLLNCHWSLNRRYIRTKRILICPNYVRWTSVDLIEENDFFILCGKILKLVNSFL